MFNLNLPDTTAAESFTASYLTIRSKADRVPYVAAASTIHELCASFDILASGLKFDLAESEKFKVDGLDGKAMAKLYDNQFAQGSRPAPIRNSIKNAAPNELCPYCGEGRVTELDHYLPKVDFAGISVHPANLVPAGGDCNRQKRAYRPGPSAPAILHPYFDTAFNTRWLDASLTGVSPQKPVVVFTVNLDRHDPVLEQRLNAHLEVFDLRRRFSVWAAQALNNFEELVRSPYGRSMTIDMARRHLRSTAIQQSGGRTNSWEGATHEAMAASDWYLTDHLDLSQPGIDRSP